MDVGDETFAGGRGRPRDWYRPCPTVVMPTPRVAASEKGMEGLGRRWIPALAMICWAKAPLAWVAGSPGVVLVSMVMVMRWEDDCGCFDLPPRTKPQILSPTLRSPTLEPVFSTMPA